MEQQVEDIRILVILVCVMGFALVCGHVIPGIFEALSFFRNEDRKRKNHDPK